MTQRPETPLRSSRPATARSSLGRALVPGAAILATMASCAADPGDGHDIHVEVCHPNSQTWARFSIEWADDTATRKSGEGSCAALDRSWAGPVDPHDGATVIARLDGREIAREHVAFSACDWVGDLGYDPAERRSIAFRLWVSDSGLLAGGGRPSVSCLLRPVVRPDGERWLVQDLWLDAAMVVLRDGQQVEPHAIERTPNGTRYEIVNTWPADERIIDARASLNLEIDDIPTNAIDIGFDWCTYVVEEIDPAHDVDEIVLQHESLVVDGGTLAPAYSRLACVYSDGSAIALVH